MLRSHPVRLAGISPATVAFGLSLAAGMLTRPCTVYAQDGCPGGAAGCSSAPIAYHFREGLPVEFDFDTGWQPGGSPVQVRFHAALQGHTQVDLAGRLQAAWPVPMALTAAGTPGGGSLAVDYGVQFEARVRLHLPDGIGHIDWEGGIPYVPTIDFRAMATQTFDPWAWDPVHVQAMTARVHIADIPLTDAIIHIPGISGGLTFDASGALDADYHSTDILFGLAADPITAAMPRVQGMFTAGSFVEYSPQLEGQLDYLGSLHIHPGLYVSLAGHRWMIDIVDIPIPIGPFNRPIRFDPSHAHLPLPAFEATTTDIDFGDVTVGATAVRPLYLANHGEEPGAFLGTEISGPFSVASHPAPIPDSTSVALVATFAPVSPGPVKSDAVLLTNDPSTPRIHVHVHGNGLPAPYTPDAGTVSDGDDGDGSAGPDGGTPGSSADSGCGCDVPGRAGPEGYGYGYGLGAFAVALAVTGASTARRRGRRRGSPRGPGKTAGRSVG